MPVFTNYAGLGIVIACELVTMYMIQTRQQITQPLPSSADAAGSVEADGNVFSVDMMLKLGNQWEPEDYAKYGFPLCITNVFSAEVQLEQYVAFRKEAYGRFHPYDFHYGRGSWHVVMYHTNTDEQAVPYTLTSCITSGHGDLPTNLRGNWEFTGDVTKGDNKIELLENGAAISVDGFSIDLAQPFTDNRYIDSFQVYTIAENGSRTYTMLEDLRVAGQSDPRLLLISRASTED